MIHRLRFAAVAAAILVLCQGSAVQAGSGTLAIGFNSPTLVGGSDLSNATSIDFGTSPGEIYASSAGTGDYASVSFLTFGTSSSLDPSNLSAFNFSIGGFSFTSNAQSSLDFIESRTATEMTVYLRGDFNGTDSSVSMTFNQSGSAVSGSFTLHTPAIPPTPEPSSLVLGSVALVVGGVIHRLRRRSNGK